MANAATALMNNLRSYKTYTLKYPVATPDGSTITEVTLRRLKGSDQAAYESQDFNAGYKITKFFLTRLSNLIPEDIDEFDQADLQALGKLITDLVTEGKSED